MSTDSNDLFLEEITVFMEINDVGIDEREDVISDYLSIDDIDYEIVTLRDLITSRMIEDDDLSKWSDYIMDILPTNIIDCIDDNNIDDVGAVVLDFFISQINEGKWDSDIIRLKNLYITIDDHDYNDRD